MIEEARIRVSAGDYSINVTMVVLTEGRGDQLALASATIAGDLGSWWVSQVFVPESRRGQGIGGQLLERLKQEVKQRDGFKEMIVCPGGYDSDPADLDRFYRRHGFVPVSATDEEDWSGVYVWDGNNGGSDAKKQG